nr:uncharacterized protein LOC106028364 [Cavia porcellus]
MGLASPSAGAAFRDGQRCQEALATLYLEGFEVWQLLGFVHRALDLFTDDRPVHHSRALLEQDPALGEPCWPSPGLSVCLVFLSEQLRHHLERQEKRSPFLARASGREWEGRRSSPGDRNRLQEVTIWTPEEPAFLLAGAPRGLVPREASTVSSLLSLSGLTRASPPHEDVVTATPSLPRPAFPEPSAGFGLAAGHQGKTHMRKWEVHPPFTPLGLGRGKTPRQLPGGSFEPLRATAVVPGPVLFTGLTAAAIPGNLHFYPLTASEFLGC